MSRANYQVLVIPYFLEGGEARYCVFKRADAGIWQFVAGGGEREDASVLEAAKREAFEEAGILPSCEYVQLDTCCSIPANCFEYVESEWGRECFVVPEYAFGVMLGNMVVTLSCEHVECKWTSYEEAQALLEYDSNKTALWELSRRIELGCLDSFEYRK